MGFQLNFNAAEVPADDYDKLPAGTYLCVISDTTQKSTKRGDGSYAELTCEVIEGDLQGRKIWERLNLENPNAKTIEIAMKQLRKICLAVGKPIINDTSELVDIPVLVTVRYKDKGGEFGPDQQLTFAPAGGAASNAPRQVAHAGGGAANAGARAKPWERGRA
jgi:hypothetical protein